MSLRASDLPILECPCIRPTNAKQTRFSEKPLYQEGLYDLGHDIFAWMVPNGSWGESNSGLVKDEHKSLLIDTLWDHEYTSTMLDVMKEFTHKAPITTLINTHADGDHFWGNYLLKNIEIIASEATLKDMSHHVPKQMTLFNLVGKIFSCIPSKHFQQTGHWFQSMGKPYTFNKVIHTPANRSFNNKLSFNLENRQIECLEVGPAHRPGDTIVYIPEAKTLFTADILFIGSTPVMWSGPVENWIKALDLILSMDIEKIVPGHGPITNKDGVQLVKDYWLFVHGEAFKKFSAGISVETAAEEIILSDEFQNTPFINWDSPERMMTNCHILYKHYSGNLKPLKPLQIINLLRKQAILANKLPEASPKKMRL